MKFIFSLLILIISISYLRPTNQQFTPTELRSQYRSALLKYEGASYAAAGEPGGISCSTLIRRAFIDTLAIDKESRQQIQSQPCYSVELREGCNGHLSNVLETDGLDKVNYEQIQIGDIATLGDSVAFHSMAYIGNKTWIHADPIAQKVSYYEVSDLHKNIWSVYKVKILRWNVLDDKNH